VKQFLLEPSKSELDAFAAALQSGAKDAAARGLIDYLQRTGRNNIRVEAELSQQILPSPTKIWHWPVVVDLKPNHLRMQFFRNLIPSEPNFTLFSRSFTLAQLLYECATRIVIDKTILFHLQDVGEPCAVCWNSSSSAATLIPDELFLRMNGYQDLRELAKKLPAWREREPRIYWRGQPSGALDNRRGLEGDVDVIPRAQLCRLVADNKLFDCRLTNPERALKLAASHSDIFSDKRDHIIVAGRHRFGIDIDGWGTAWMNLFSKMLFGCTILKVASPRKLNHWIYPRLVPWQHYVPVKADMSDLVEKAKWIIDRPDEAERMAANSKELADNLTFESEVHVAIERILGASNFGSNTSTS
jgi:hypothetical protein